MEVPSINFEFKDYKKAFDTFRNYVDTYGIENIQMVVSEHPYSSGYWLESSGSQVYNALDHRYTGDEVFELEKRVIAKLQDKNVGKHHNVLIL